MVSFFLYLSASIFLYPYKESEEEELAIIIRRGESGDKLDKRPAYANGN